VAAVLCSESLSDVAAATAAAATRRVCASTSSLPPRHVHGATVRTGGRRASRVPMRGTHLADHRASPPPRCCLHCSHAGPRTCWSRDRLASSATVCWMIDAASLLPALVAKFDDCSLERCARRLT